MTETKSIKLPNNMCECCLMFGGGFCVSCKAVSKVVIPKLTDLSGMKFGCFMDGSECMVIDLCNLVGTLFENVRILGNEYPLYVYEAVKIVCENFSCISRDNIIFVMKNNNGKIYNEVMNSNVRYLQNGPIQGFNQFHWLNISEHRGMCLEMVAGGYPNDVIVYRTIASTFGVEIWVAHDTELHSLKRKDHYLHGRDDLALFLVANYVRKSLLREVVLISRDHFRDFCKFDRIPSFDLYSLCSGSVSFSKVDPRVEYMNLTIGCFSYCAFARIDELPKGRYHKMAFIRAFGQRQVLPLFLSGPSM